MLGVPSAPMQGVDFKGLKVDTLDTDKVNKGSPDIGASYHSLTT